MCKAYHLKSIVCVCVCVSTPDTKMCFSFPPASFYLVPTSKTWDIHFYINLHALVSCPSVKIAENRESVFMLFVIVLCYLPFLVRAVPFYCGELTESVSGV